MKRILLGLLIGIFFMSGICLAAGNRPLADAIQDAGLKAKVAAAVAGTDTSAISSALDALKVGASAADVAQIEVIKVALHRNWIGADQDPVKVAAIAAKAKDLPVTANPLSAEALAIVQAEIGADVKLPGVVVLPQAEMQGIIGPMLLVAENKIVIGDVDMKAMSAMPAAWAHEATEAAMLLTGTAKDVAHQKAEAVEGKVIAQATKLGDDAVQEAVVTQDAARTFDAAKLIPAGGKVVVQAQNGLSVKNRADLKAQLDILINRGITVEYRDSLPADGSRGTFHVQVFDKDGSAVRAESVVIDVKGNPVCKLYGALNEGLIAASIPNIKDTDNAEAYAKQWIPAVNMLKEQHKANTTQELAIPADPKLWPAQLSRIIVQLPPAKSIGIANVEQEQQRAALIFGKMA